MTDSMPQPTKSHVVYYLALSPTVIKIGTTGDLPARIKGLRTSIQYVVALEQGGHELETQRHRQFHAERLSRREDFRVSERLQAHIDHIRRTTRSDELIEMYRSRSRGV
ncbi:hypothetical protein I5I01_gp88 [Mycobacterium phage MooMoo]|uniref:GIY-YIG nuclease family protein n=1 Tax=Mycobacterium phage MooMoo TaxID=2108127 RepID=A0A2P1JRE8_9CAUD|nr:hypothetical protein I5I01_gp88 [Mycobacterium phage MooMoo]AVO21693.1 hypothetical protein SEA_MOOMOO_88 [Mycobacterium phage MooMoo]